MSSLPESAVASPPERDHLLRDEHLGLGCIRNLYAKLGILPTSTVADTILIRSWIAYHRGSVQADRAIIKPSRGHSYTIRNTYNGMKEIARISDYYDHRNGVDCREAGAR